MVPIQDFRAEQAATALTGPHGVPGTAQVLGGTTPGRVGADNLCHQAIFMNHAPCAVTPLDPELIQVCDAVG